MTSISFIRSAVVALLLSISASVIYFSTTVLYGNGLVGNDLAIRLTISAVTLGYVLFLFSKTSLSFGKLSFVSAYLVAIVTAFLFSAALIDYALFHVGFIWLVRTVYYHNNFLHALIDLAFSVVSFTAALGAIMQSHSVFISFWCFFLTQALILPVLNYFFNNRGSTSDPAKGQSAKSGQSFYQAHRNAQAALRKLATNS